MKKSDLKKYAKVVVNIGANVQKGQEVIVNAPLHAAEFIEYVVEAAYKKGAKRVSVNWNYSNLSKIHNKYQKVETLCEVLPYDEEKLKYNSEVLPVMINIGSPNPDAMKGMDMKKLGEATKAHAKAGKKYRDQMNGKYQWTAVAYPSEAWAKKVFPDLSAKAGVKELWKAIALCTRLEGDPIENWKNHDNNLLNKKTMLTDLSIKELTFKSKSGTDFTIELLENTQWAGGGLNTLLGKYCYPNMPTEEVFISPNKTTANGVVYSSKPLSIRGGKLVDNFGFKFENGKVVEVIAQDPEHKEALESLVNTDEGARMLGEVALVPFSSPINQTGLLFYNTLYDENACCHLALGRAFDFCIKNYENMSIEEKKEVGLNDSLIHVDFMIGTKDLSVTAKTFDSKEVQIFKDGEWSI